MLTNTASTASYGVNLSYSAAAGGFTGTIGLGGLSGSQTYTASLAADTNYAAVTSAPFTVTIVTNNVWVANANGSLSELSSSGTAMLTANTGSLTTGVSIDNSGNIWTLNNQASTVSKYTPAGVRTVYSGGGISTPLALTLDGNGSVWVTNYPSNSLSELNAAGTPVTTTPYVPPVSAPTSITVDGAGNLWITNYGDNSLVEVIGIAAPVVTPTTTAVKNNAPRHQALSEQATYRRAGVFK